MTTVFVTGAGGFIGGDIARRLAENPEFKIKAGTHKGPSPSGNHLQNVTIDVEKVSTLERAFEGVDVVVHCAAGPRIVSVNGTQAVLNAAKTAKVKRLIYISCTTYYGLAEGVVTEATSPRYDEHTTHGLEKHEVEGLCRAAEGGGLSVTILRASTVLGPGGLSNWTKTLTRRLQARKWGTIGKAGDGTANVVDCRDLAAAVALAIQTEKAAGQTYNVNGEEQATWNVFFDSYNQAMDFPYTREIKMEMIGFRVLAAGPLKLAANKIPFLRAKAEQVILGAPTFAELDRCRLVTTYATDAIRSDLGWQPKIGLKQSIQETAAWAKDNKMSWLA